MPFWRGISVSSSTWRICLPVHQRTAGPHGSRDAAAQEEGEWTIFWSTVAVVAISLAVIISEFANTNNMPRAQRNLHVILWSRGTLFVSWLIALSTSFAFRYAHEFYETDPSGTDITRGLEFPGEKRPDYLDFMYFSLVLGMTFQVSDVQITARKFRRLAAVHGLLSFLFNTIILALTVNIAAGRICSGAIANDQLPGEPITTQRTSTMLSAEQKAFVAQRIGRLATADALGTAMLCRSASPYPMTDWTSPSTRSRSAQRIGRSSGCAT